MELLQSHLLHMMLDQWSRAAAEERPVLNNNLHDESREPLQDHNPLHGPPSSSSSSPSLQKNEELRLSAEQLLNIVATYFVTVFSPKSDPIAKTKAVTASEAERVACLELTTKLYAIVAERTPDLLAAPAHHHTASYFVQSGLQCVLDGTSSAQERDAAITMLTAVVSCLGSSTARAVLPGVASGISKFLAHAVPLRMRNEGKERVSFLVQVLLFFQRLLAKCFPEGPSVDPHHAEKGDVAAAANAIWSKLAPFLHLLLDSEKLVASIFQQGPRALSEALLSFTMEAIHSLKRSAVVGTPAPLWSSTSLSQVPSSPEHFLRSWTVTALTLWATQQPDLVATAALPSLPEALVSLPSGALTVDLVEWLLTLYWTTSVTTAERNVSLEQRGAPLAVLFALLCLEKPTKAKKSKKKDNDASNVLQTDEIVAWTQQRWELLRAFLGKNIRRTKGGDLFSSLKGTSSSSVSPSFLWPSIKRAIRVLSEWPERSELQQTRSERTNGGTCAQTCSLLDVIESFVLACGGQIGSLVAMEEEGEEEERDDVDESSLNNLHGERDAHADGGARNRSKERCRDEMALLLGDWDAYQSHQAALFVSCRLEAGTLLGLGRSSQREHIMRNGCPMREPKQKKVAVPLPETKNEGTSVQTLDDPPVLCKRCQKQADQWFAANSFEQLWEEHLGLPHLWQIEDQQEELSFQQGRHRAQMACTILGCLRLLASSLSALSPRHVQRWTVVTLYNVLEKASSAHEDVRLAAMKTIQALGRLHHVDALSSEGTLLFVHQFSSCLVEDAKLAIQDPEVRQSALYVLTALLQLAQQEVSAWGSNVSSSSSSTSSCRVVDGGNAARMLDVVCHMLHHVIDTVAWSLTWDRSAVTPLRQCVSTVHQLVMRYPRRNPPEDDWDHDDEHHTTSTEPAVAQLQRSLEGALLVMHRLLLHSRGEKAHLAIPIAVSIVRLFQKSPESDSDTKKPPPTGEMPPQDENPAPQMNEEGVKEEEELPSSSSQAPPPMTTDLIIRTQLTTVHMVYSALFQILSAPLSNADLPSLFAIVSAPEFAAADVIRRPSSTSSSPLSSSMTAAMRRVKWLLDVAITLDVIEAVAGMSQLVALAPAFLGHRVRSEVVRIVLVYYIRCARLTNIPTTRELKLVQAVTAFLETLETVVLGVTLRETAADGGSGGAADEPTSLIRLIVKKEHLPAPK